MVLFILNLCKLAFAYPRHTCFLETCLCNYNRRLIHFQMLYFPHLFSSVWNSSYTVWIYISQLVKDLIIAVFAGCVCNMCKCCCFSSCEVWSTKYVFSLILRNKYFLFTDLHVSYRFLSRVTLDRLARKMQYPNRWKV